MKNQLKTLPIIALGALCCAAPGHAATEENFGLEQRFAHPVKIPAAVLQRLKRDITVSAVMNQMRAAGNTSDPATWFTATRVNLNGDKLPDLLVKAKLPALMGANIGPFWVFNGTSLGYKQAFRADTLTLRLLASKTRGYRDIRTRKVSAQVVYTTLYRWNGRFYALAINQPRAPRKPEAPVSPPNSD